MFKLGEGQNLCGKELFQQVSILVLIYNKRLSNLPQFRVISPKLLEYGRTPLDIFIFIFAEEGKSSCPNVQNNIFLASVNFFYSFYQKLLICLATHRINFFLVYLSPFICKRVLKRLRKLAVKRNHWQILTDSRKKGKKYLW